MSVYVAINLICDAKNILYIKSPETVEGHFILMLINICFRLFTLTIMQI